MGVQGAWLPRLPDGWRLDARDSVGSTNEVAAAAARDGAAGGLVVWARQQTRGRGRRGRAWTSPPGNISCSLLLRPAESPAAAAQLGFVAALAVADVARDLLPGADIHLKWPNDVLVNGRKVSGILLEGSVTPEGRLGWLVVGIGFNVAHHPPDTETPSTDLATEGGVALAVEWVLEYLVAAFDGWRAAWSRDGFGPIRAEWLARARDLGGPVRVRLDRETFEGRFLDLDETGALIVELPAGDRRQVTAGDVFSIAA